MPEQLLEVIAQEYVRKCKASVGNYTEENNMTIE